MRNCSFVAVAVLAGSLAVVQGVSAQGLFVTNGFSVNGGYFSYEDVDSYGGSLGYVYRGVAEAGIDLSRTSEDGIDLNSFAFAPFGAVYPVRQSNRFPLSVRLGGQYAFYSFSGDFLEGEDVDGDGFVGGATLFREFIASRKVSFVPAAGAEYIWVSLKSDGVEISEDGYQFRFGLSGVYRPALSGRIHVTPTLLVSDAGDSAIGVAVGFVRSI